MITIGTGVTGFCPRCGKEVSCIVKTANRTDGYKELLVTCPGCGSVLVNKDVTQQNAWFLKEQQCFREKKGMFLVIEGKPVPQGRPRFASVNGRFIHAYDPRKSVAYKNLIQWHVRAFMGRNPTFMPLEENVFMDLKVFRPIPGSFSKKKEAAIGEGKLYPNTKPDTDNYVKAVLDACNGLVFHDDSSVIGILARKYYSALPRIELSLYEVDNLDKVVVSAS